MSSKIGVGIITCDRKHFFDKCFQSIPDYIDELIVVNDGDDIQIGEYHRCDYEYHKTSGKIQVGPCKNIAMKHLLNKGCDYIFTLEDDILIRDPDTFKKYIDTSLDTGIEHFNFGFSQKENLDANLKPVYKKVIEYKNSKIVLTPNILGAFTFYTRNCLQHVGLHHRNFNKGHGDHPELTYRAYKHGFTTPFWWFADIYGSWDMIENQSNMGDDSLVRNQPEFWSNFREACSLFCELHGYDMLKVPMKSEQEVIQILKDIKKSHGK
jgi:glycosyltransferase involved in cell wall biosynthesis